MGFIALSFQSDLVKMHALFCSIHPPNGLSKCVGLVKKTLLVLSEHFSTYPEEVLHLIARTFTLNRLRLMNDIANKKKKGTLRGKNTTSRLAHNNS